MFAVNAVTIYGGSDAPGNKADSTLVSILGGPLLTETVKFQTSKQCFRRGCRIHSWRNWGPNSPQYEVVRQV